MCELTLEKLVFWLETKPPDGTYTDSNPSYCLVAEYLGKPAPAILPEDIGIVVYRGKKTYGAALERARAALTATQTA